MRRAPETTITAVLGDKRKLPPLEDNNYFESASTKVLYCFFFLNFYGLSQVKILSRFHPSSRVDNAQIFTAMSKDTPKKELLFPACRSK